MYSTCRCVHLHVNKFSLKNITLDVHVHVYNFFMRIIHVHAHVVNYLFFNKDTIPDCTCTCMILSPTIEELLMARIPAAVIERI